MENVWISNSDDGVVPSVTEVDEAIALELESMAYYQQILFAFFEKLTPGMRVSLGQAWISTCLLASRLPSLRRHLASEGGGAVAWLAWALAAHC